MNTSDRLILIIGMARSGTSLTAGLFAQHGVWTGQCMKAGRPNPRGYFEHIAIKRELQQRFTDPTREVAGQHPTWRPFVEGVLKAEGYPGGPWLVKHNAIYHRLWHGWDPVVVMPRRSSASIFQSMRAAGFHRKMPDSDLHRWIDTCQDIMDAYTRHGGVEVFPDQLAAGNLRSLHEAFEAAGLDLDEAKARAFIAPDLWKHGG